MAFVVGGLYAAGVYLLLRRSIVSLILGLAILGNATNLLIFTAAGLTKGHPPLIPAGSSEISPPFADPLPQALILTAIVIGFGVLAFTVVLIHRTHQTAGTDDMEEMKSSDRLD